MQLQIQQQEQQQELQHLQSIQDLLEKNNICIVNHL
jgi:hypothetical protein